MKTLIIYLSASGKTKRLAHEISGIIGDTDLLPIKLKTRIPKNEFWLKFKFGLLMTLNWGFRYSISEIDLRNYSQIIVGSPVWMGTVAPPLIKVVKRLKIENKIRGAFVTFGGEPGNVFGHLSQNLPAQVIERKIMLSNNDDISDPEIQFKLKEFAYNFKLEKEPFF